MVQIFVKLDGFSRITTEMSLCDKVSDVVKRKVKSWEAAESVTESQCRSRARCAEEESTKGS